MRGTTGRGWRVGGARLPAIWLVAVLVSGCWPQVGTGPEHRRFNVVEESLTGDNVTTLAEVWSTEIDGAVSEPIVSGGHVYLSRVVDAQSAAVRSLQVGSGATVWDRTLATGSGVGAGILASPVAFSDDDLWVGYASFTSSGPQCPAALARLAAATGQTLSTEEGALITSPPVAAGPIAPHTEMPLRTNCSNDPMALVVRDADTQATLWRFVFPGPATGYTFPTVADGHIFVALGATLYGFDAAGCGAPSCPDPLWTTGLGGNVVGPPVAGPDGQVFVTTNSGELFAIAGDSGEVLWQAAASGQLALADTSVFVAGGEQLQVYPTDGCGAPVCSPVWSAPLGVGSSAAPAVAGGVVYAGGNATVHAFAADGCGSATCSALVTVPVAPGGSGPTDLVVAEGTLFVAQRGASSRLTAFRPST